MDAPPPPLKDELQHAEPDGVDRATPLSAEGPPKPVIPPLASLTQRAAGAMLDKMLAGIPLLLIALRLRPPEIGTLSIEFLNIAFALLAVQGAINVFLLVDRGQTLGKMATRTRIVRTDGNRAGFFSIVWRRGVINSLLGVGMPIYLILDFLLIFRANQRCIHDYIAGTIVVQA